MIIRAGYDVQDTAKITQLYWQAFGAKLGRVMRPEPKAHAFIARVLDPSHAISAYDDDGTLLGVAGFKTSKGALVGGTFRDLSDAYGLFGADWRDGLLALLERDTENERFLMDGIFVAPAARGRGIGTALLDAIMAEAKTRGYAEVRLDVIDSNPRARALYERVGFVAGKTHDLGPLRHVFGFRSATTMICPV
ncbi:MAG: GNAT family N-acetyltransferase [Yoonia sp.]